MPSASNSNKNNKNSSHKLDKECALVLCETATGGVDGAVEVDLQLAAISAAAAAAEFEVGEILNKMTAAAATTTTTGAHNNNNSNNAVAAAVVTAANNNNNRSKERATAASDNSNDPLRLALVTIEHKIRNLEKRKTKLESYREIQSSGKELSSDQKAAVAKFDAVIATLEFARDLSKQLSKFVKDAEKEQKKQARKEIIVRAQAETAKIREVLIIQNILNCFSDESVRNDFLNGGNGAIKLQQNDMDVLEKFALDIQVRRPETADDTPFHAIAQKAAEHLSLTIDARPKQYGGSSSYDHLRRIFNQIQQCNYLDKIYMSEAAFTSADASNADVSEEQQLQQQQQQQQQSAEEQEQANNDDDNNVVVTTDNDASADVENVTHDVSTAATLETATATATATNQADNNGLPAAVAALNEFSEKLKQQQQQQRQSSSPIDLQQQQQPPQQQQHHTSLRTQAPLLPVPPLHITAGPMQTHASNTPVHVTIFATDANIGAAAASAQLTHNALLTNNANTTPLSSLPHYATTVRQLERGIFKQHQQQQQQHVHQHQQQTYLQQMRPLAEVIGGSSFYFLQESELDSPEIMFEQTNKHKPRRIVDGSTPTELNETTIVMDTKQQQQQQQQQLQQTATQQSSIQTQTFTNQSFPPPAAAQQQQQQPGSNASTPTSMFQQQKKPLFSPNGQQLAQEQQQQQQQQQQQMLLNDATTAAAAPPMLVMSRGTTTTRLVNMPATDASDNNSVFNFTYEQQMQQQLAAVALKSNAVATAPELPVVVNEWQKSNAPNVPNQSNWHEAVDVNVGIESPNALNNNVQSQKNKWSTIAGGTAVNDGVYLDGKRNDTNHWDAGNQQQQDVNYYGKTSGSGGGGNSSRALGNANYQRRGGAAAAERDDRRLAGAGNAPNNYRARNNNYGNATQGAAGQAAAAAGNAANTARNNVYFRNNENASNGGAGNNNGANNSYYSNGSGAGATNIFKDAAAAGNRYDAVGGRNAATRGNGQQNAATAGAGAGARNNAQPQRSASYMNSRLSNRLPNKERL